MRPKIVLEIMKYVIDDLTGEGFGVARGNYMWDIGLSVQRESFSCGFYATAATGLPCGRSKFIPAVGYITHDEDVLETIRNGCNERYLSAVLALFDQTPRFEIDIHVY